MVYLETTTKKSQTSKVNPLSVCVSIIENLLHRVWVGFDVNNTFQGSNLAVK